MFLAPPPPLSPHGWGWGCGRLPGEDNEQGLACHKAHGGQRAVCHPPRPLGARGPLCRALSSRAASPTRQAVLGFPGRPWGQSEEILGARAGAGPGVGLEGHRISHPSLFAVRTGPQTRASCGPSSRRPLTSRDHGARTFQRPRSGGRAACTRSRGELCPGKGPGRMLTLPYLLARCAGAIWGASGGPRQVKGWGRARP